MGRQLNFKTFHGDSSLWKLRKRKHTKNYDVKNIWKTSLMILRIIIETCFEPCQTYEMAFFPKMVNC